MTYDTLRFVSSWNAAVVALQTENNSHLKGPENGPQVFIPCPSNPLCGLHCFLVPKTFKKILKDQKELQELSKIIWKFKNG